MTDRCMVDPYQEESLGDVMPELVIGLRYSLAILLLLSSLGKLLTYQAFMNVVTDYALLPRRAGRLVGIVLPWIELFLGIWLLVGVLTSVAAALAGLLIAIFTVAVIAVLRRGQVLECGCLGAFSAKKAGWGTVVRNVALLIACLVLAAISAMTTGVGGNSAMRWLGAVPTGRGTLIPLAGFAVLFFLTLSLLEQFANLEQLAMSSLHHPLSLLAARHNLRRAPTGGQQSVCVEMEGEV